MKRVWIALTGLGMVPAVLGASSGGPDLEAERQALLAADRDFALETSLRGGDGWADWFAPDGVMYPPTGRVDGQEAIRKMMLPAFTPDGPRLVWEPMEAVVGSGGDLGYTLGRWQQVVTAEDGTKEIAATGNYVSIWKKVPEVGWRVAVDIGNRDPKDDE